MLSSSRASLRQRLVFAALIATSFVPGVARGAPESSGLWRPEWRRAAPWEYYATGAALAGAFYLRFLGPQADVNWRGGILFDDGILDRVAIQDLDDRNAMARAGDIVFLGSMAYRAVDSLLLPLAVHGDPDLALQMTMIDLEAFGTVGMTVWGSQVFVVRERPIVPRRCGDPEVAAEIGACDPESKNRGRSFIAGHVATVFAATGVTCLHHAHMPLYGGGAGDVIACASMVGATAFTAANRVMIESHYPSDVVFGLALGAGAGWLVPMALHYGFDGERKSGAALSVVPWFAEERSGMMLVGVF
jgi:membrane-associated phospholipid phosphatase